MHDSGSASAEDRRTLIEEIQQLKSERNAVVLAHYYQRGEIQDVADDIGDSFKLAQEAARTSADVIVLAGVMFMAETAKILSPGKTVLIPDAKAGCPLADSAPVQSFASYREQHPEHLALTYINSSTEVKAFSDIICTSSVARKILAAIPKDQPVLFSPDENLGRYIGEELDRDMLLWKGNCLVHMRFSPEKLSEMRSQHPDAKVAAHPECERAILDQADFIGSTSAILKYSQDNPARKFIIVTEPGIIHQMKLADPTKEYLPAPSRGWASENLCRNMKKNTLEKLHDSLLHLQPEIYVDEQLAEAARTPIQRMLDIGAASGDEHIDIIRSIELPFQRSKIERQLAIA
ncbi:MAG: quinolinate synthase [Ectothiorhodospiraceae bacterium]|nr:quinolinate synthase [Ectothiorhodospiraceae bacterium]